MDIQLIQLKCYSCHHYFGGLVTLEHKQEFITDILRRNTYALCLGCARERTKDEDREKVWSET